jgi:adenosylcobinamide amidohydrolase
MNDQDWHWTPADQHFALHWQGTRRCLSSAALNGGVCEANRLLNLKVSGADSQQPPEQTLQQYADSQGWTATTVGMMTAASMDSLRWAETTIEGERLAIYLTSGLSNARCAGDPADWQNPVTLPPGTINIVCISNMQLSVASMTEIITLLTEAKTHVLHKANIRSPVSGERATGTGTDSIAVIGGSGKPQRWFGKHTLAGQRCAELLIQCLTDSIV